MLKYLDGIKKSDKEIKLAASRERVNAASLR